MAPLTTLLFTLTILSTVHHVTSAEQRSALRDLEDFVTLYEGEFSNARQNAEDVANNITGSDLHLPVRYYTVPVRVNALRVEGVESRQLYLEQYYNNAQNPTRQRIYHIRLENGIVVTSTYRCLNNSYLPLFSNWREDRSVFEDLEADLLTHDPLCDFAWERLSPALFNTKSNGTNCQFNFGSSLVYIESEVNVTEAGVIQDETFNRVSDGSRVAGTTLPYIFDRIGDVPPLPGDDLSSTCRPVATLACLLPTNFRLRRQLKRAFPDCFQDPAPSCNHHIPSDIRQQIAHIFGGN